MTDQETLFAQLRKANPVPEPDALLESRVSLDTGAQPERNIKVTSTNTTVDFELPPAPPRRRPSLAMAASIAAVIVVIAGLFALLRPVVDTVAATPAEVATSFFTAINENDPDGWWALHSDDAFVLGGSLRDDSVRQSHQDYFDWRTTTESRFEEVECAETGGRDSHTGGIAVSCDYVWRGPIQDAFGVSLEGYLLMAIDNGLIVNLTSDNPDFAPMRGFPIQYLNEHHGAEFQELCGGGPGAFNGGAECARLYMDNLDAMAEAWEAETGG